MVSGLFSDKTVVHLSTAPATASFEHAVAVCTETPAPNRSTTALTVRRVRIISSSSFGDITSRWARLAPETERIAHVGMPKESPLWVINAHFAVQSGFSSSARRVAKNDGVLCANHLHAW